MNKKEVAEIKKNFTDSSGFFTLNHIVSVYVDPHKNVRCKDNKLYALCLLYTSDAADESALV